jgi:DnaJ-class molecular chaperone
MVRAAQELADEGDYFTILGLGPQALAREVRDAYLQRHRELSAVSLETHGLDALEDARQQALEAVEEAYAVLGDERLRHAYAAALG